MDAGVFCLCLFSGTHLSSRNAATVSVATSVQVSSGTSAKSLAGTARMMKSLSNPSSLLGAEKAGKC